MPAVDVAVGEDNFGFGVETDKVFGKADGGDVRDGHAIADDFVVVVGCVFFVALMAAGEVGLEPAAPVVGVFDAAPAVIT